MEAGTVLEVFIEHVAKDGRIGPTHISLYVALYTSGKNVAGLFTIERNAVMQRAGISSRKTYHRRMKELHAYGYINYQPSPDPKVGSVIRLL